MCVCRAALLGGTVWPFWSSLQEATAYISSGIYYEGEFSPVWKMALSSWLCKAPQSMIHKNSEHIPVTQWAKGLFVATWFLSSWSWRNAEERGGNRGVHLRKPFVCCCVFQTDKCLFFLLSPQETKCCLLELLLEMGLPQRRPETLVFLLASRWQPPLLMPMLED